ncbi:hypothetical protein [Pseudoblastomonas halimionae]|uniref:Uncharacterized protein n=1 Tax=Alteriqipengyuania halimionae TaxID=1926630 RepID=A0A6I4U7M4_9SPHN|nr:hypothetical protein [Alteriqipengyuania halimionae]MXP10903.1 hypothetical protein [Alteriqipengyuania halimionae]
MSANGPIDRIVFGDNQFFGINHMSQDKAQERAERFAKLDNVMAVYDHAIEAGIEGIMLNSNDRAKGICDRFRADPDKYGHLRWYPSIPYPHKYASMVNDRGMVGAVQEILFAQGAKSALGKMLKGGMAVATLDAVKLMKMLVDQEMEIYHDLDVRVVFLQNVIVDLMLGYDVAEPFKAYCEHIRKKYGAYPGLITQNLPFLRAKLIEWGIEDVVICASINKIGYLMSPGVEEYEQVLAENDGTKYPVMAMSTLASGAVPPAEAYEYINRHNIQSVVFGASSPGNIRQSVSLIEPEGASA